VFDYTLNIQYRNRVHAGEGLVEEHEQRVSCEGAGDLDAPALATGEADPEARAHMSYVEFVQQLLELLLAAGTIEIAAIFEDCENILFHRQFAENGRLLRQVTQAHAGTPVHG
jgi:hypothetical protein